MASPTSLAAAVEEPDVGGGDVVDGAAEDVDGGAEDGVGGADGGGGDRGKGSEEGVIRVCAVEREELEERGVA